MAAAASGVGMAAQHRAVARRRAEVDAVTQGKGALSLLGDLEGATHHEIEVSDGGYIHIVDQGQGFPILLIHGVTLTSAIWGYQLVDLADGFRVLAMDQRGHGLSRSGREGYSLARLAADVAEVITALGLDKVVVVGHSMGGMAAIELGVSHPKALASVAGLILTSTTAGASYPLPWAGHALGSVAGGPVSRGLRWMAHRQLPLLRVNDVSYWLSRIAFGRDPSPAHVAVTEAMVASMSAESMAGLLHAIALFDDWDRLGEVFLPTLVIVGSRDNLTPPFHGRRLAREIPDAKLVLLEGAGHMPMLERREEFGRAVAQFCADVQGRRTL